MQTITEAQAAAAFEAWEKNYRANPADFLTEAEIARMKTATVGQQCAIYFMGLLRQGTAENLNLSHSSVPLCTQCKHYEKSQFGKSFEYCQHTCLGIDPVNGNLNNRPCSQMREGSCGAGGALFEAVCNAGETIADSGTQTHQGGAA